MLEEDVRTLVKALTDQRGKKSGEWINFSCIFAPWFHEDGSDRHFSAGISINEHGPSYYHCFSCAGDGGAESSPVVEILNSFQHLAKKNLGSLLSWVDQKYYEDIERLKKTDPSERKKTKKPIQVVLDDMLAYPESALEVFKQYEHHPYLKKRGIDYETYSKWEVGYDDRKKRITIPVRCPKGKLLGIVGRSIVGDHPLYYNYWGFKRSSSLMGGQFLSPQKAHLPLVVVEGPFDALKVSQAGFHVVATMGSMVSRNQARLIRLYAEKLVVLFFDNDQSGKTGTKIAEELLAGFVPIKKVFAGEKQDPGDLSNEEIKSLLSPVMEE